MLNKGLDGGVVYRDEKDWGGGTHSDRCWFHTGYVEYEEFVHVFSGRVGCIGITLKRMGWSPPSGSPQCQNNN